MSIVLSQFRWPSLAQDLAVMLVPGTPMTEIGAVCAKYGVSEKDIKDILQVPSFQQLFKQALDTFKSQGSKAGTMYRASVLSSALAEKLFDDANSDRMDAKDAVKLLELLLKTGGLLDSKGNDVQVNVQTNVALPLPVGLNNPKLSHLRPPLETTDNV